MRTLIPPQAGTCCSDPMSYVFQRFSVQMMHCSGVAAVCASARLANCVAILFSSLGSWFGLLMDADCRLPVRRPVPPKLLGFFLLAGRRVVNLHGGAVSQGPQHLVTSGDDLL